MSNAVQFLESASKEAQREKYPNVPHHAIPAPKYNLKTANGLTKAIVDFVKFSGGMAERTGNTGRYLMPKTYTNVFGKKAELGKGKWIPGTGRNGTADIHGIINGKPLAVEVKIGKDRQSREQKKYQEEFEAAGGAYILAKDFEAFYKEFEKLK